MGLERREIQKKKKLENVSKKGTGSLDSVVIVLAFSQANLDYKGFESVNQKEKYIFEHKMVF